MLKGTSNNQNRTRSSEMTNPTKEKVICKDGFCALPNQKEISKKDTKGINLFDPI